ANIYPVLGEHEYMAKKLFSQFEKATSVEDCANYIHKDDIGLLEKWLKNGGNPTLEAFLALNDEDRESVIDYLGEFEPFEEIEAAGRKFVLVHAGIRNFEADKPLDEYDEEDFIFEAADYGKAYFADRYLVTGHTPTVSIAAGGNGKVYSKKRHLAIDCSAFYGGKLAAVCLDTLKAYYC
ncbi:MAG: serine/threonine protein phosphatase, partial [Ruminococcus sp.]|nr:serine/threonine protein phosphatase [Ruminococcus sp.]